MCGIAGYMGRKPVVPVLLDGLEYSGYDSAGIAVANEQEPLRARRRQGKPRKLARSVTVE